jgi:adenine-specific DNA-methyltransferase
LSNPSAKDKRVLLQSILPEVFEDGVLSVSELLKVLAVPKEEPMTRFLIPEKLLWDEEKHLSEDRHSLIRGENLSVLRSMSSFQERIKMIFIDPPYNTGKDFAYADCWKDVDAQTEFTRHHGVWLEMMGPRVQYAHALLQEDGVIFISIDDHELAQLRMLCDAIFGVSNFVQTFLWLHGKGKKDRHSRTMQQYILCYAKNKSKLETWKYRVRKEYGAVSNPDEDPRGAWFSGSISFSEKRSNPKHKNYFSITSPSGLEWNRQWLCTKEEMETHLAGGNIYFGPKSSQNRVPRLKIFPFEDDIIPPSVLRDCGTTREAQLALNAMFEGECVFPYPKSVLLLKQLIRMATRPGDWILDFFAGSATTMQAVLELGEDEGERMCICIQSAEETPEGSVAHRLGLNDVFSIAEKRVQMLYAKDSFSTPTDIVFFAEGGTST